MVNSVTPRKSTRIPEALSTDYKKLKSATCYALEPPTVLAGEYLYPFEGNDSDFKIYVPAESLEDYKAAVGWSRHPELLHAIE